MTETISHFTVRQLTRTTKTPFNAFPDLPSQPMTGTPCALKVRTVEHFRRTTRQKSKALNRSVGSVVWTK